MLKFNATLFCRKVLKSFCDALLWLSQKLYSNKMIGMDFNWSLFVFRTIIAFPTVELSLLLVNVVIKDCSFS